MPKIVEFVSLKQEVNHFKRKFPTMSKGEIASDSGLSLNTIERIFSDTPVTPKVAASFREYVKAKTAPYHASWPQLAKTTRQLYVCSGYYKDIKGILFADEMFKNHGALTSDTDDAPFFKWLYADVAFDKGLHYSKEAEACRQDRASSYKSASLDDAALTAYATAHTRYLSALESLKQLAAQCPAKKAKYDFQCVMLTLSMWSAYFNSFPKSERATSPKVRDWLSANGVIDQIESLGSKPDEVANTKLHRNGLLAASVKMLEDKCRLFYDRLLAADGEYKNLSYLPDGSTDHTLKSDPDLDFFRQVHARWYPETGTSK